MANEPQLMWIDDERPYGGDVHVFTDPPVKGAEDLVVKYIRADVAETDKQLAIAAALTRAAKAVREWGSLYSGSEDVTDEVANDILALITEDAQAALDRYIKERSDEVQAAVAAALREAADAVREALRPSAGRAARATILALITEDAQAALGRVAARVATAERERIVSIYRKLSTGSAVGAGDGDTFAVRYVDPEQFAAAIREGGE